MITKRVRMEPELEEIAGTFQPPMRRLLASKLRRWAHELEVSADVLARDAACSPAKTVPRLSGTVLKTN